MPISARTGSGSWRPSAVRHCPWLEDCVSLPANLADNSRNELLPSASDRYSARRQSVCERGLGAAREKGSRCSHREALGLSQKRRVIRDRRLGCRGGPLGRAASDAFEHGYWDFDTIRTPAKEVLLRTAAHLRCAILRTMGMEENMWVRLLSEDFAVPRGPVSLIYYLHGKMIGKVEELAAKDQPHPFCEWRSSLKTP